MPNWKVHLEVGKRLNKYLGLKKEDYELFLLGNILPDINNGYVVSNIHKIIKHSLTHFEQDNSYEHHLLFLKKYRDKINEPLYLGYYVHLFTDYYFNKNYYEMVEGTNIDKDVLRKMKQHDFKIFDNVYIENSLSICTNAKVIKKINIDEVDISSEDIDNVIHYLNHTPLFEGTYQIYTLNKLEEILKDTVLNIYYNIKGLL